MKNPWKSRHPLFWVNRVYGIQNDHHDLTINDFLMVWKTMHRSQIYLQFFFSFHKFVNISCYSLQTVKNLKKLDKIVILRQSFWIPLTPRTQKSGWGVHEFFLFHSLIFQIYSPKFISQMENPWEYMKLTTS